MEILKRIKLNKIIIQAFYLSLILILLRQSAKDYFQIFLGAPLRLISAKIIEKIFILFNVKTISENSILIFENNITNIDYPCSGSLLIYYFFILIFLICLIKVKKPELKLVLACLICLGAAVCLNIIRIFVLIVLSLNNFDTVANFIHIPFGIVNFITCGGLFYFLINDKRNIKNQKDSLHIYFILISYIFLFLFYGFLKTPYADKIEYELIKHPNYKNLPVNKVEESLFKKYGAQVQKYNDGKNLIIKIKSNSPQAIHNPELCLKNQGFKIIKSKIIYKDNKQMRMLKTNKGTVYYYFQNGENITADYYLRVFLSIFSKNKTWELIMIY